MCFDETKRKVNYKFFVRGQERSLEIVFGFLVEREKNEKVTASNRAL